MSFGGTGHKSRTAATFESSKRSGSSNLLNHSTQLLHLVIVEHVVLNLVTDPTTWHHVVECVSLGRVLAIQRHANLAHSEVAIVAGLLNQFNELLLGERKLEASLLGGVSE